MSLGTATVGANHFSRSVQSKTNEVTTLIRINVRVYSLHCSRHPQANTNRSIYNLCGSSATLLRYLRSIAAISRTQLRTADRSISHWPSTFVTMEDRPEPQSTDCEKLDGISEPSPEIRGMGHSASSSTANTNAPVAATSQNGSQQGATAAATISKPSILKRVWGKLGINAFVVMFMVKGALPPTIAISIYQRYSVAVNYLNLGYVMIVISILTVPVLPRGKYLMNLFVTLVSTSS